MSKSIPRIWMRGSDKSTAAKIHSTSAASPIIRPPRMSSLARVTIHSSQFPESVRSDLIESLRKRQVNHKFHYDSVKQTHQWLALHQAYSPSRMDPDCETIYNHSFEAATDLTRAS